LRRLAFLHGRGYAKVVADGPARVIVSNAFAVGEHSGRPISVLRDDWQTAVADVARERAENEARRQAAIERSKADAWSDPKVAARAILAEARLDGAERPDPFLVAKRLGVVRGDLHGRDAQSGIVGGTYFVRLRRGLEADHERSTLAHMLGRIPLERRGLTVADESAWSDAFGAELTTPTTERLAVAAE
jgi:hypothetical protein